MLDLIANILGISGATATLIAVLGGAVALLMGFIGSRRSGAKDAEARAKEADNAHARDIEDAADRARAGGAAGPDALERLRRANRIRD